MLKFYRLDTDDDQKSFLTVVDECFVRGESAPDMPEEFHDVWFELKLVISPATQEQVISIVRESGDKSDEANNAMLAFVGGGKDEMALPTYHNSSMIIEGVTVPQQRMVYIAESEEDVWKFLG